MNDASHNENDVAIIGMSIRFPGAKNTDEFWKNLCNGVESITFFNDEELKQSGVQPEIYTNPNYVRAKSIIDDIEYFDAKYFNISPKEAELMDPQHRLFLECSCEALEMSGYCSDKYDGRIGVYGGVSENTYFIFNLLSHMGKLIDLGKLQTTIVNDKDYLCTRVSYKLNLKGPSLTVQTSCSTALVNVHLACQSLLSGECDMALAGAASISIPQKVGYMYKEGGIYSPDGHCRAFDNAAKGTAFGDGVGVIVLKRLQDALTDGDTIQAVIKGTAINNDGGIKLGYTAPSIDGQANVISEAMFLAGVEPQTIDYIETHGTGTSLGDPIEFEALKKVFQKSETNMGKKKCILGAVKTNIGHLNTVSGMAGLIKTVLILRNKKVPPTIHFNKPNHNIDLDNSPFYINRDIIELNKNKFPHQAGVSSFGVGGTNAHIVLEEAPESENFKNAKQEYLICLSAKTRSALDKMTNNLVNYLKLRPNSNLADVAYTLQIGRKDFVFRRAVICQNVFEVIEKLENYGRLQNEKAQQNDELSGKFNVFMFPGQGSQYVNMGRGLYENFPFFRKQFNYCANLFKSYLDTDIQDIVYPKEKNIKEASKQIIRTEIAQPVLFSIEYSLSKLLIKFGIYPKAMIGHSVGEYVAACLAEVFSLKDAIKLVSVRGKLMQSLPCGAMLAVPMSETKMRKILQDKKLSLAAVNGPSMCVVSGEIGTVNELKKQLVEKGFNCRLLQTSHAFHSKMQKPIIIPFLNVIKDVVLNQPKIPYISNLTGDWIKGDEVRNPSYWVRHLIETVQFEEGIIELSKQGNYSFMEIGPGNSLSTFVRQILGRNFKNTSILPTMRHPKEDIPDISYLLTVLGKQWVLGNKIEWTSYYLNEQRKHIPLPTYPFEKKRFWVEQDKKTNLGKNILKDSNQPNKSFNLNNSRDGLLDKLRQVISNIYTEVLGVGEFGLNDSFFSLGGNSLIAAQLISKINSACKVKLPLKILFESPAVEGIAQEAYSILQKSNINIEGASELGISKKDIKLDSTMFSNIKYFKLGETNQIFLTGSTGFVGVYVLNELLKKTKSNIYCLVRCTDLQAGKNRIKEKMKKYLLWDENKSSRIIPIKGDLTEPLLGLSKGDFQKLADTIDVIYHLGAQVNWVYPYSELRNTNVLGTREIIRLASSSKVKPIHFVSSVAVFDSPDLSSDQVLYENTKIEGLNRFSTGYAESKWASEKLLLIANSMGVPVKIYRPAYVVGDSSTGICNTNDFIFRMIKGCIQLGIAPDLNLYVNITPVSYVARTIVFLSNKKNIPDGIFHLTNPSYLTWKKVVCWISSYGYSLKLVQANQWTIKLRDVVEESHDNALKPFLFYFSPNTASSRNVEVNKVHGKYYDCRNTLSNLKDTHIACPPINNDLFLKYISYLIKTRFLNPPLKN